MARRKPHEEHANHEAWAIPYGDLITLLLAFFVVMYAMSSVNEGKYRVLSDALNAEFRGAPRSMTPIQIGEKQRGSGVEGEVQVVQQALLDGAPKNMVDALPLESKDTTPGKSRGESANVQERQSGGAVRDAMLSAASTDTTQALEKVATQVEAAMSNLIRENLVAVRRHGLWVEVEVKTDILFPSGVASLSPFATSVLQPLADAIAPFNNPVRVEGHTDNVPITTAAFPSNWELSAARAASVVHLFTKRGIDPSRLTVIGLGEYRPAKPNATADGRDANRRVVLVILGSDETPEGAYGNERAQDESPIAGDSASPVTIVPATSTTVQVVR
jgi:chemotaxis protein MotB